LWSLLLYVWKVIWPAGLALPYPYVERSLLGWRAGLGAVALVLAAWLVVRAFPSRPWLMTGSAWYALGLLPVLGLIQTGPQAYADRFMYLPLIGVGIVVAWGAADLAGAFPPARRLAPWVAAAVVATWVTLTRAQVERWRNTVTLFAHAIEVTDDNRVAHHNLATALALGGDLAGAERHYREAVRIEPRYAAARSALGVVLARQGRLPEALDQQQEALRLAPSSADAHLNVGLLVARMGRPAEAAARYAEAVRLDPTLAEAQYSWGNLEAAAGRFAEAEARFREAVRLQPGHLDAANNLALAMGRQGAWAAAAEVLGQVVAREPNYARARVNLGRALLELGRPEEAKAQWHEVLARSPQDPVAAEAREELARLDSVRAAR
jgi:tetratricopeptide (TPR) repeat protein